jgi:hypothetical protein
MEAGSYAFLLYLHASLHHISAAPGTVVLCCVAAQPNIDRQRVTDILYIVAATAEVQHFV